MRYCITLIAALLLVAVSAQAQLQMVVLDSITVNCSTDAQERVLWMDTTGVWMQPFSAGSGTTGLALWHEFEASASGTVEIKYTEQMSDLNGGGTADEYDDNDWNTLETAMAYDATTDPWAHHALTWDAAHGIRVYLDHSDATGTHTVYLIGHERK